MTELPVVRNFQSIINSYELCKKCS